MRGRGESWLSRLETVVEPAWELLVELAVGTMGYDLEEVEAVVYGLSRALGGRLAAAEPSPILLSEDDLRGVRRVTGPVGRASTESLEEHLLRTLRAQKLEEARKEAKERCSTLLRAAPPMRRLYVDQDAAFQTWQVAERLCDLSERAAARSDGKSALEIAQLACHVAELFPAEETWRTRVRGYCQAFLANAWRALCELEKAEESFLRALDLWGQGGAGDPERILAEWRLLDLEASLRRAQQRFSEALGLHERAREAAPEPHLRIVLNEAITRARLSQAEKVVEILRDAAPLIEGTGSPRLAFQAGCLLVDSLCRLGRFLEAEEALRETRDHATALREVPDMLRVLRLSEQLAAGLGQASDETWAVLAELLDFVEIA